MQTQEIKKIITLTESSIREIKRRIDEVKNQESDQESNKGLRVGVKGGGCSGLSYVIDMDFEKPNDLIDESAGVKILVDPKSALYLKDVTLDYDGGFMGSGFKFINPQATNSCGCGESFSI